MVKYIKPTTIADILEVSRQAIYRYIHKTNGSQLPSKKVGKRFKVDTDEFLDWYEENSWRLNKCNKPIKQVKKELKEI